MAINFFFSTRLLKHCAFILLLFLTLNHLLVLFAYLIHSTFISFAFPLALLFSILIHVLISNRFGLQKRESLQASAITLLIILLSIALSTFFYDFSWDGQWYHQAAIYHLERDWNPILEPIKTFDKNNDLPIIHFPKGSWYFAASTLRTFGNLEAGKSINWIVLMATIFFIHGVLKDIGFSGKYAAFLPLVVVLNPVIWSEITTYLVDGLLFLYLAIYATAMVSWIRNGDILSFLIGLMAAVLLINVKFTGLVFFCVFAFYISIYIIIKKRSSLWKYLLSHLITITIAVLLFGFNPYVTNFVQRGHPFYPIVGTKAYPSIFTLTGRDDNELYETPQNMVGKSYFTRLFLATFGRPGNAPYNDEKEAELIWPFTSKASDWKAYHYHETRVSGFGPFFSGIFLISLVLIITIFLRDKKMRWLLLLTVLSISTCLFISKHFWWPRFAPQTWLIILLPMICLLYQPNSLKIKRLVEGLAILIAINGFIVLIIHMGWEVRSSISLRKELSDIRLNHKMIEIDYGWFKKSMEEKLKTNGIKYKAIDGKEIKKSDYKTITSVVDGYPNAVIYRGKSN